MTFRIFILSLFQVAAFGAGSDVYIQGRNPANTAPIQTTVAPAANSLLGFSNTKVPVDVAIGAGLALSGSANTVTVNTTQNITKLSNLTSNGLVSTSGGDGTLGVDTSGYITASSTDTLTNKSIAATQLTGTIAAGRMPAFTGDATSSAGAVALTLATANSNVGIFGSATATATVTLNAKGLVTAGSNTTITPAVGSITGLGTGVGTFLATPSSANLAAAVTDETGSGAAVFATSPTLVTPILGTPTSGTLNNTTTATASAGTNSTALASTAYADRSAWNTPPNAQTASFTFALADQFRPTTISNASANTATIPPNSSVAFPAGTTLILYNIGAGQCTWTAGAGVTLVGRASAYKTAGQYAPSYAWQTATTDTWIISGDVTP